MWYCSGCDFATSSMDNARDHPWGDDPSTFGHVLFLRESPTAPAMWSMHASDAGGCYVDKKPGGMLDSDPYRLKQDAR
jgi:hypothetical protein